MPNVAIQVCDSTTSTGVCDWQAKAHAVSLWPEGLQYVLVWLAGQTALKFSISKTEDGSSPCTDSSDTVFSIFSAISWSLSASGTS